MKKLILYGLSMLLVLTIVGCSNSSSAINKTTDSKETIVKKDTDFIKRNDFTATPLIVTFHKAQLHKISDLTDEEKAVANIPSGKQYYIDIEYDVKNPSSSMYGWNGYDTMLIDGEQINAQSENFGEVKGNEIQPNATIKNNSIKIATNTNAKEIKLIPSEPLKDNSFTGDEPAFNPSPIIITLK